MDFSKIISDVLLNNLNLEDLAVFIDGKKVSMKDLINTIKAPEEVKEEKVETPEEVNEEEFDDPMYSISKEFYIEYAHRLLGNPKSKCYNLHGHSAKIIITINSEELNSNKMIVDFNDLRDLVENIEDLFDHATILNGNDPLVSKLYGLEMKTFVLKNGIDPTSEILARIIWDKVAKYLNERDVDWDSIDVTFYETARNSATYSNSFKPI